MAETNGGASAGDKQSADAEITELKIKCGNYAEKCMQLMQEHQTKELAWKEREVKMVKKLEDALTVIKKLKAQVTLLESKQQVGTTHEALQHQVELVTLQKQNQTLTIEMKSLKAEVEMKTLLESKKSRLVDLLDAKLSEKGKLIDLMMMKIKHKDSKVALCEARMAQLNKLNAEMALALELKRQQLKKHGIDPGEPFEIEHARKAARDRLEREQEDAKHGESERSAEVSEDLSIGKKQTELPEADAPHDASDGQEGDIGTKVYKEILSLTGSQTDTCALGDEVACAKVLSTGEGNIQDVPGSPSADANDPEAEVAPLPGGQLSPEQSPPSSLDKDKQLPAEVPTTADEPTGTETPSVSDVNSQLGGDGKQAENKKETNVDGEKPKEVVNTQPAEKATEIPSEGSSV